ncbi:ABC transporter, ATP-binding protein [Gleimia coleocanis DSM 15436]|uniref:ABC-type quaternary amine transporter n=1 Tax=Gleimia coleocanis DSM 15436 TaxID=525245 RepID=C0VZ63_9ACTO|nr:ATP-binding cassette domain-containing protein [Gleimia coleocanis]EEH64716.1 ABC transporter, ATP-binding protein [Gleimia coleocanis DSM 15436]
MIEFKNVSKQFPNSSQKAVDDFSYVIPSREIHVFLGSSGCGKTTLLRCVNRMEIPTSGQILWDDQDVAELNPVELRRSIGYVMQSAGLMPHRTVLDNVTTVLRLRNGEAKLSKEQIRSRGLEMLELVGLDPQLASRYPAQLSGGQAQRVGVARALAPNPRVVLMDEPFAAVDPLVRTQLQDLVRDLQRELKTTILFVTHDVDEAVRLADKIIVLSERAQIRQAGTARELLSQPADQFVADFLGINRELPLELGAQNLVFNPDGRPLGHLSFPEGVAGSVTDAEAGI